MKPNYVFIRGQYGHPRAGSNGCAKEHLLIAECALGRPLVHPELVHHVNGIRNDNRPENLVICQDDAYHQLLHIRTKILAQGGDPDTQRVCRHCGIAKPFNKFCASKCSYMGRSNRCHDCRNRNRTDRTPAVKYRTVA